MTRVFSAGLVLTFVLLAVPGTQAQSKFSWSSISPSSNLTWQECFPGFQCARLRVPLDYANPDNASAAIALVRIPANVSTDDPGYRGPMLFNPGGPGVSGVESVLQQGPAFSQLLGDQFDIVGFDPRGIGKSTPGVSFFESNFERLLWDDVPGSKDLNATPDALETAFAKAQITNILAAERAADVIPFITTDFTARDMMNIVEAHGREKLSYWGVSYGTALGMTFATMFPDKIERAVIDGVLDADQYYATNWNFLNDTAKALGYFFSECVDAGPDGCPFYAPTPELIQQNLTALYDRVKMQPVPVPPRNGTACSYDVLDFSSLHFTVALSLYNPFQTYRPLAAGLAALAQGDASILFDLHQSIIAVDGSPSAACDSADPEFNSGPEVQRAIICNDGAGIPNKLEDAQAQLQTQLEQSEFGGIAVGFRIGCSGWSKLAKNNFQGPVGANTSYPILFIGNDADPVTSLGSAVKMSSRFPGSVVLTQNYTGHTSLSAPSKCTQNYIRQYLVNGTLPDDGTLCSVDSTPFKVTSDDVLSARMIKRGWKF